MASRGRSNANKRLGQGNGFEEWVSVTYIIGLNIT